MEEAPPLKTNADIRHLLDSLVSALAVYATAFRSKIPLHQTLFLFSVSPLYSYSFEITLH